MSFFKKVVTGLSKTYENVSSEVSKNFEKLHTSVKNKVDDLVADVHIARKLSFAKVMVSLWSQTARSDSSIAVEEEQVSKDMIEGLFGDDSIFPKELATHEELRKELQDTYANPLPVKFIAENVGNDTRLAVRLYEDAIKITMADGKITASERSFLDGLADALSILPVDKEAIERRLQ